MPNTKLIIDDKPDFTLGEGIVSLGRVPENSISFNDDVNVSRFHVEIEPRDGDFWLIELGSSNGTSVNGKPVTSEILLKDGDVILLGGTSKITFEVEKEKSQLDTSVASADSLGEEKASDPVATSENNETVADAEKTSKPSTTLLVMGGVCGLAVILVVGAVLYATFRETKCNATAVITSPDSGDVISKETEIEVEVQNTGKCVQRVIYVIEDKEIASANTEPFKGTLDPSKFPQYAEDGDSRILKVVIEDENGNKVVQNGGVLLNFETLATPTPTPEDTPEPTKTPKKTQNKQLAIGDIQEMLKRLNAQFPQPLNYTCNIQCLQEIQKKTAEYVSEGYYERAKGKDNAISDTINVAFVRANVPASLGYFLAMSRSKFNLQKQGAEEGMWRMSSILAANTMSCGTETLSDPTQNCAAQVTAVYMKNLLGTIFEQDVIYSVAAFGMPLNEAAIWNSNLPPPPNRADFMSVIKDSKQREEVIRFLAAGIVAENPQRFGLTKQNQPISELYKITMGN